MKIMELKSIGFCVAAACLGALTACDTRRDSTVMNDDNANAPTAEQPDSDRGQRTAAKPELDDNDEPSTSEDMQSQASDRFEQAQEELSQGLTTAGAALAKQAQTVNESLKTTMDQWSDHAEDSKEEFVSWMNEQEKNLDQQWTRLKTSAAQLSEEANQELSDSMEKVEQQRGKLAEQIDQLGEKSGDELDEARESLKQTYSDLVESIGQTADQVEDSAKQEAAENDPQPLQSDN